MPSLKHVILNSASESTLDGIFEDLVRKMTTSTILAYPGVSEILREELTNEILAEVEAQVRPHIAELTEKLEDLGFEVMEDAFIDGITFPLLLQDQNIDVIGCRSLEEFEEVAAKLLRGEHVERNAHESA
jgi:hypothetical protein